MKPLRVKDLYKLCKEEISKGNGDMVVMLSDDDEGNGYHYCWYAFTTTTQMLKPFEYNGKMIKPDDINGLDKRVAPVENTIILG